MHKNVNQTKTNLQNKNKRTKNNKGNMFLGAKKLLRRWTIFVLRFCAFLRSKSFHKENELG